MYRPKSKEELIELIVDCYHGNNVSLFNLYGDFI